MTSISYQVLLVMIQASLLQRITKKEARFNLFYDEDVVEYNCILWHLPKGTELSNQM